MPPLDHSCYEQSQARPGKFFRGASRWRVGKDRTPRRLVELRLAPFASALNPKHMPLSTTPTATMRCCCVFGAALLVSSCGGGGGGGSVPVETPYEQIMGAYGTLATSIPFEAATDLSQIPTGADAGATSYTGYVVITPPTNEGIESLAGDVELEVNFADTTLQGSSSGFYSSDGSALTVVDGSLNPVLGNAISMTGAYDLDLRPDLTIAFDLQGNLSTPDGDLIVLDLGVEGDFVGENAAGIRANVLGTATLFGVSGTAIGDLVASQ